VFARPDGHPLNHVTNAWVAAAERAALGRITPHDCRRSAIRNLVRAGVPTSVCMEWSGHWTFPSFDRYDINDNDDRDDAATKVEAYVTSEQAKPSNVVRLQKFTDAQASKKRHEPDEKCLRTKSN
jgi:integrase